MQLEKQKKANDYKKTNKNSPSLDYVKYRTFLFMEVLKLLAFSEFIHIPNIYLKTNEK